MNVTLAMIKPKDTVIISSRSENPLFLRDAISSFRRGASYRLVALIDIFIIFNVAKEPDRTGKTCRRSGSSPTGTGYGLAVFIVGRWGCGVKARQCNERLLVFCNGHGDSGHMIDYRRVSRTMRYDRRGGNDKSNLSEEPP